MAPDDVRRRLAYQIAEFGAKCRVPPSTVYMTAAHAPYPSEVREACWVLNSVLSDLDGLAELLDARSMLAAFRRAGKLADQAAAREVVDAARALMGCTIGPGPRGGEMAVASLRAALARLDELEAGER